MISPPFDWSLCRSFLEVLRAGSLSGAARGLGVAHPTVRRHLEEMEAALGVALFARSPTGLVPTELALSLRDPVEAMESAYEQLQRTASAAHDAVEGTVRITASEVMGTEVLPPILHDLRVRHSGLSFELDLSDDLADVLRRDADIAVRMARPTQPDAVARRVAKVDLGLFAHRRWLDGHGSPPDAAALLSGRHLIGYDRGDALIEVLRAQGIVAQRGDFGFRSDNTLAQLAALRAGLGVGVCQAPLAARDDALTRMLPELAGSLEVWLVSPPGLRGSPRIRACLDGLAEGLAAYAAT